MVFSIPSYLCCGDRSYNRKAVDERAKGTTFYVTRPKTGHNPDALIDKEYHYMWNGERGGDPETVRRREANESAKKRLTPNGFVYASPTPKGVGLGSYYGCFQSTPYVHAAAHPEKHGDHIVKKELPARGIYTSPAPKGTGYGFPGLTLSDVGTEYIANIYDQERLNALRDREAWRAKMPSEPFKPAGRRGYTFDESLGTGTSRCYIMTTPFREKRSEKPLTHFRIETPWRPAGYIEDKTRLVEYWEDPYRGFDPRKEPKEYVKKPSEQVFYPSPACDHFWYTQSIVFKRI